MRRKLPERHLNDGPVKVSRIPSDRICISAVSGDRGDTIVVSEYNATRILVSLCIMLEVPIPRALGKLPIE